MVQPCEIFLIFQLMLSKKDLLKILYHLVFWLFLFSIPYVLLPIAEPDELVNLSATTLFEPLIFIVLFYFNSFFLFPNYFLRRKTITYIIIALIGAFVASSANILFKTIYNEVDGPPGIHILLDAVIGTALIAASTVFEVIKKNLRDERTERLKENENLKTELSFLRSQISPHFMFNVLNTIVALIRQKSEKLEPVVIELSNLMRYMLYESDEEKVNLRTELEYLKSYINIQILRFGDDIKINIEIPVEIPEKTIEPMLLIPLVENAFKHGCGIVENPEINISIAFSEQSISMMVKNKYSPLNSGSLNKHSGIGLNNLRKRLALLYAGKHELDIERQEDWFSVYFKLQLKN